MLTAAISGSIFASPSVSQIVNTVARAGGQAGTILIIKNYTGDIFHFYLAAEKARAKYGLKVGIIVVADDVSVGRAKSGKVGRRGLAGTVFVHKILGAMSRVPGKSFDSIVEMGKLVTDSLVTVGVSHGHVHIPGRPVPEDSLNHDQVELGMGIHNESGCQILSPRPSLPDLVKKMLDQLLDPNDSDRAYVDFKDAQDVVLLVNNLGSLSVLELGGITHEAVSQLSKFSRSGLYVDQNLPHTRIQRPFALKNPRRYIYDKFRWSRLQHNPPQSHHRDARIYRRSYNSDRLVSA